MYLPSGETIQNRIIKHAQARQAIPIERPGLYAFCSRYDYRGLS